MTKSRKFYVFNGLGGNLWALGKALQKDAVGSLVVDYRKWQLPNDVFLGMTRGTLPVMPCDVAWGKYVG